MTTIKNGKYTIQNTISGAWRTFKVSTKNPNCAAEFMRGKRVVSLLSGPDNEHDYTGFGFVDDTGVHVWRKRRGTELEKMAYMLQSLTCDPDSPLLAKGYRVMCEAHCLRCNRTLTTPESIERGIGPECYSKM